MLMLQMFHSDLKYAVREEEVQLQYHLTYYGLLFAKQPV